MRILQIGDYPENENVIKGGIQSSLYGLVNELVKKNHYLSVISLPNRNCLNDCTVHRDNLNIYYFSNKRKYNVLGVYRFFHITRRIKASKPDICHLHGTDLMVFLIYIYCRLKGIPSIVTVHGLAYIEKRNAYRKRKSVKTFLMYVSQSFFEFMILNILDKTIVDTRYVATSIISLKKKGALFHLPEIYIIPQGINEQFFQLPDEAKPLKILSVGSIGERKGHLFLIKAIEKIISDFPGIKLNIIGRISNPQYYEMLNDYVSNNNLKENIKIHKSIAFDDLKPYYITSNLFALHSEEESQGIVFCEAMACGKPIVATNSGGIPDVVSDGKGGFLSSFADTFKFSENIKKILVNEELRKQFSLYNKTHALQYSWPVVTEQIIDVYKKMIA